MLKMKPHALDDSRFAQPKATLEERGRESESETCLGVERERARPDRQFLVRHNSLRA